MTKTKAWKPRAGERELLDQVRVAAAQIDAEPGGRLGWIVGFAREDPALWLPANREAHGYCLLAFVHPLPPNLVGGTSLYPLQGHDVMALHAELHEKLRALVNDPAGRVDVPSDGFEMVLIRASAPGAKPAVFGLGRGGPMRTMLWQAVASLIFTAGDRLLSCPTCREPFLALRKMKYCSPKCTQQWWDREKVKAKQGAR